MYSSEKVFNDVTMLHVNNGMKRKCISMNCGDGGQVQSLIKAGKNFVTVQKEAGLFQTEAWLNKDTTVFIPIVESTSLRVNSFDQITFPAPHDEAYFVGNVDGIYTGTLLGRLIHFWKYSEQKGKMFVAKSILCTESDTYEEMCRVLSMM